MCRCAGRPDSPRSRFCRRFPGSRIPRRTTCGGAPAGRMAKCARGGGHRFRPKACHRPFRPRCMADLMPASSPGVESRTFVRKPLSSAQRRYMRSSISAQSCHSMPPAPGLTVRIAFRLSLSRPRRVFVSRPEASASAAAISFATSSRIASRCAWSVSSCAR